MKTLIKDDEYIKFQIEFEEGDFEASASFTVYEVTSWDADTNEVLETEQYLKGYIKWDGCSHIWFGKENGYLHLCGKQFFENHKKVMDAIWDVCSKKIKSFDNELAS